MIGITLVAFWNHVAQAAGAALVAVLLHAFQRAYGRGYLRYWAWSWAALALQLVAAAAALYLSRERPGPEQLRFLASLGSAVAGYLQTAWLVLGAYEIASGREAPRAVARSLPPLLVALSVATTAAFASDPGAAHARVLLRVGLRAVLSGTAYMVCAWAVLRLSSAGRSRFGRRLVAAAFVGYGVQQLHALLILLGSVLLARPSPWYTPHMGLIDLVLQMGLGLSMVTWLLEDERELALGLSAEKQRAERARAEAARFTEELVASAGEGLLAYDRELRYVLWNPFMERLTDVPAQRVLGRSMPEVFPELAEHGLPELLERALRGEVVTSNDVPFKALVSGRSGWTSATYAPRRGVSGEITGVIVVVRDVTERRLAERALKDSEERYRFLFENNPQPMFVYDTRSLSFLAVNDAALALYGYSREEFQAMGIAELAADPGSDRQAMRERIARLPEYLTYPEAWRQRRKDGTVIEVDVSSHRIALGEWSARLVMARDVTDRARAEAERARLQQALLSAAAEWKGTFDAIDSLVVLLDPTGRVTRLNRAAMELAGGPWEASLGAPLRDLGGGEPWASAAALAAGVRRHGGPLSRSAKDSKTGRTWAVSASRFEARELQQERTVVVARDITESVQLEETLRRKETMSAMGSLVAGVAHEVRNPLFGISSTLDAFEARFGRSEQFQRYLETLRGQVGRLGDLMNELLEYGRPLSVELQPLQLGDLLEQAVQACDSLARRGGVSVATRLLPGLPATPADRKRIVQVFQNIIDNAIRHTPPGGSVTVEAELHAEAGERWLRCAVRDSGPGFAPGDLPRAFEPFFTRRRGGTGLGLSIVQRIVEQHGGRLLAENHPLGGAQLTVLLRAVDEAPLAAGY
jgi:PAS domain S-box-containing protein